MPDLGFGSTACLVPISLFVSIFGLTPARAALPLIPQPQEIQRLAGAFVLCDGLAIAAFPPEDRDVCFAADEAARELGCKRAAAGNIAVGLPARSETLAALCRERGCLPDASLGDQGYVLVVTPNHITIAANTGAGVFYGVQTLLQLAQIGGDKAIPCVRIRDWPALKWRGVLTDQSRQAVPKVETYKRMIRELARYKMNFVSMHLEHTFVVQKHPLISAGTGALTAAEVREICDYGRQYHCLFFPSFEAFGHQSHIFKHPQYAHLAESDWKYSFAPAIEGTYSLLSDIFDEMCPAFSGTDFFNAGCDEVGDLGTGQSKELAARTGKAGLYAQHMNRVHDLLKARGKRMMMWGDMLLQYPEAMDLIPKDTIILDWHYGPARDYLSIVQFRRKGFEVFVVPALSSWCRLFPDYYTALDNIEWFIRRGREHGAIGSMTCNWGDDGNENLIAYAYYGWLFAAECSWGGQPAQAKRGIFDKAFCRQLFGTDSSAPAEVVHLLSRANLAGSRDTTYNWRFFHDEPFTGQFRTAWPRERVWRRAACIARQAEWKIDQCMSEVSRNRDVLEAYRFAALRTAFVAEKMRLIEQARRWYWLAYTAQTPRSHALNQSLAALETLRSQLARLRDQFVRQWNLEFKPEGIEYNLRRFDAQLAAFDDHIARLKRAMVAPALPHPTQLDLDDRTLRRILSSRVDERLRSSSPWAVHQARWRVPVRIGAGCHDRTNAPVLVEFPLGVRPPRPTDSSPPCAVLITPTQRIAAQAIKDRQRDRNLLAFVLPGTLKAGAYVAGDLYLWQGPRSEATSVRTDQAVTATTTPKGIIISTSAYEALVGSEGAHVYTWKVAKLDGLDITHPGESGWAGWFDVPGDRTENFELTVECAGPIVAIVRGVRDCDYEKTLYFWGGLPYAECFLSEPVGTSWAFDSTANFAADAPMPGLAHLSNGLSGQVPASTEQRQFPQGGGRAWWCCKTRADGLTLGLITPVQQTNMKVGPGGGWGGVGIEGSNPCQYFVVFADVDPRGPAAVEELYHALARDDPINVTFGNPQTRD